MFTMFLNAANIKMDQKSIHKYKFGLNGEGNLYGD